MPYIDVDGDTDANIRFAAGLLKTSTADVVNALRKQAIQDGRDQNKPGTKSGGKKR